MLDVAMCMTMGGRPELFRRTVESLFAANREYFSQVILVNDIGDQETTALAHDLIPSATIIHHRERLGHHRSVDEIYAAVSTRYIFQCEDDWSFDPVSFIPDAVEMLRDGNEAISAIAFRQSGCMAQKRYAPEYNRISLAGRTAQVLRPPPGSPWGSFSFNPTLIEANLWRQIGPYSNHKNEAAISVEIRERLGKRMAYMVPGVCYHTGAGNRVVGQRLSRRAKLLRSLKKRLGRLRP